MKKREEGPVEILCKEIDFHFDNELERVDLFVAFVSVLVAEISKMRNMQDQLADVTGVAPSDNSAEALRLAKKMLAEQEIDGLIEKAAALHDFSHTANPEDAYPTDHLIDMASSCASAIRFGLETPCHSRHAASAADHIWKRVYGIGLFDHISSRWRKDWARIKFQEAIISLTPIRKCA